jgi:hypothetical protein
VIRSRVGWCTFPHAMRRCSELLARSKDVAVILGEPPSREDDDDIRDTFADLGSAYETFTISVGWWTTEQVFLKRMQRLYRSVIRPKLDQNLFDIPPPRVGRQGDYCRQVCLFNKWLAFIGDTPHSNAWNDSNLRNEFLNRVCRVRRQPRIDTTDIWGSVPAGRTAVADFLECAGYWLEPVDDLPTCIIRWLSQARSPLLLR